MQSSEEIAEVPNWTLLQILRCPLCKGCLSPQPQQLVCARCQRAYPIILGIPDLRIYEDPLIPLQDDYRKAEQIHAAAGRLSFAELVRFYWSLPTYPPTPPDLKERFIRHVLTDRERNEVIAAKIGHGVNFLDVGCGTAGLVEVVSRRSFRFSVGCDVAFRWLVVAGKRLQESGLQRNLVCCCADHLPFPDDFFDCAAAVSVLEHVSSATETIAELGRVTKGDGRAVVWTSNRFSLAREPHVRVWGVGFLPRCWMPAYVKWRRGIAYEKKHLLSLFELRRLLKKARLAATRFSLPVITPADWENLAGLERLGALIYSQLAKFPPFRWPLILVSPALEVVARRDNRHLRQASRKQ